jgi:hypothetical protein
VGTWSSSFGSIEDQGHRPAPRDTPARKVDPALTGKVSDAEGCLEDHRGTAHGGERG